MFKPFQNLLLAAPVAAVLFFGLGCAHAQKTDLASTLKSTAEKFHQTLRWGDYRGAASFLVPERRGPFLEAREEKEDEKNLQFTDYELLELVLGEDGKTGVVVSKLSWTRLPSVTQETATVHTVLVHEGGVWMVSRQDKGPFTPELSREYAAEPTALDAGAP